MTDDTQDLTVDIHEFKAEITVSIPASDRGSAFENMRNWLENTQEAIGGLSASLDNYSYEGSIGMDGDSSSSVKVESDLLSNGGEPPTAAFIVESVDHDFKLVWNKEDSATGKVEDELVRREDHEERVQELNARWAGRLEDAVKNERERILERHKELQMEIVNEEGTSYHSAEGAWFKLKKELRGEVENQGLSKQNVEGEDNQ